MKGILIFWLKNNLFWNDHHFQTLDLSIDLSEFVIQPETKWIAVFLLGRSRFHKHSISRQPNPKPYNSIFENANKKVAFSCWAIDSLYWQLIYR